MKAIESKCSIGYCISLKYGEMKNILVTIDFTESEALLIDKAFEFAKSFDSKLWLMHVAAPDPDFVGYDVGPQYIRDIRAKKLRKEHKLIQEYANTLKGKGVDSDGLLIEGATVEMIIKESEKLNVELIIVGHHEHGFFHNLFEGSSSSKIIKRSKIPILIVPLS
jgi:nucleotide-binding universal stress UspA family protein